MSGNLQKTVTKCPMLMSELGAEDLLAQASGPENLGPVVLLHDEGPEGAVLAGSFGPDGALNIPTLAEDVLHDASVPNLKAVGAGASLLEGNLSLFVPSVGDEFVMVHKSLEGVW